MLDLWYDRDGNSITRDRWGEILSEEYHRVGHDVVGGVTVSTVWLGIDHSFFGDRGAPGYRPIIFETMLFGGDYDQELMRYSSEVDAVAGHARVVADLEAGRPPWWMT